MPGDPLDHFDPAGSFRQRVELLQSRLLKKGVRIERSGSLSPRACDDRVPLSFAQERLWFLEQLHPGKAVYNIVNVQRLTGALNVDVFAEAVGRIGRRHEILRTRFCLSPEGSPVQVIEDGTDLIRLVHQTGQDEVGSCPLTAIDLRSVDSARRESEALGIVRNFVLRPFDLTRCPLFRILLLRSSDTEHICTLVVHQLAFDWRSHDLFSRELELLYDGLRAGAEVTLPLLPIQYADYAVWQRRFLQDEAFERQASYWKARFADGVPRLEFPGDRPRPRLQSFHGARQPIVLPTLLRDAAVAFSRRNKATLFMTLLATLKVMLFRYTDQEDLTVGCPVASRGQPGTENLIGSFVNTLVFRSCIDGNPSFRQFLMRVKNVCLAGYAHQDIPFERVVEELQLERDLSRNPLFDVMFIFRDSPPSVFKLTAIRSEPLEINSPTAKFDLTLALSEHNDGFRGFLEYSTDLFDRNRIERMASHFQTLLEGILADPDQRVATLPLLTDRERHQLFIEWNDTAADYPRDACIHELFEAQVERAPDAVALEFQGRQLTYGELNRRANQLAHYLRKLGVGPEKLVGICVDRSLEMVIGLLGIMKAGAAYVPLDSAYPTERLSFMLQDAAVLVLLTTQELLRNNGLIFREGNSLARADLQLVCLGQDAVLISHESEENPPRSASAENLAYVIYTSGSTGIPKGVEVTHRSVINCLFSIRDKIEFTETDALLSLTTLSFDIAGLELYLPLLTGARVIVASREEILDGNLLMARLAASGATIMQATPSGWRVLLNAGWRAEAGFKILCGGEALPRALADRLLTDGASVWNLYGPTETTIWSTIERVQAEEGPVLIGRPIANTKVYVLDSHLQPIPVGITGELYIGGDGLARGYLKRAELSAHRFIGNPFSADRAERLYRTGDRVRYREDGRLEFLGRFDEQVKIRGYRIEPAEIETVLNEFPAVAASAVVARARDASGEQDLVAYVVPRAPAGLSASNLRNFVSAKLPHFMVPSVFLTLEALPRTPGGKIDKNALPAFDGGRIGTARPFVGPRGEVEEMVAQIWREVLKLESIGVHDNFFELGGHSLLATRVAARMQNAFAIEFPLRRIFELQTIAGLAEHVDVLRREQQGVCIPPVKPVSREGPMPVSFSQRRLWFLTKLNPELTAYNIPAAFRILGKLDVLALEKALNEIVRRHEIVRTAIREIGGEPYQQAAASATLSLPLIDLSEIASGQAETEVERLAADDARHTYDLSRAPLMRATLLRISEEQHVLILNFHHIIADASSLVVFYDELAACYEAFSQSKPVQFPPLTVQYADYAVWQAEQLQNGALVAEIEYWKAQLAGLSHSGELPADYQRRSVQSFQGARLSRELSEELSSAIREQSRRAGVTRFMTLLAALTILISRHTGSRDVIVGSTIEGRNRQEIEGLIGFFINALPLRTDLTGDPSFSDLVARVREVCLQAYTHQDVPFDRIVETINPERDWSRQPLFQVMFNMADTGERVLRLPGCEISKLSNAEPGAKFDITLYAPESDGKTRLTAVYNADLFSEQRISVLLEQLEYILQQAVGDPNASIECYSLLTEAAHGVLPDAAMPLDDSWKGAIQDLFSTQAVNDPEQLAVTDAEERWSYGELEASSNRLAHLLLTGGIQKGDIVAVYAHRSATLALALLGALKAGAAFLILDSANPPARSADYLRLARPKGWIEMSAGGEPPDEMAQCFDDAGAYCRIKLPNKRHDLEVLLRPYSSEPTGVGVGADDVAYIAFTSGSTGLPKGVVCRHGPITHFLPWQEKAFGLSRADRFAVIGGLAYNHLHRDLFTALALGAPVFVPGIETLREPRRLVNWLHANSITVLHLTPALGRFLQSAAGANLPCVRRIFFGGDVLTGRDVAAIRKVAPNATVAAFYGATETQRAVGYYEVPAGDNGPPVEPNQPLPVGRGIPDVQILVLNDAGGVTGIGELGNIHVRSPHLAARYVDDDGATNAVFLVNPFTGEARDRLYKTGDKGRYLPDGNIQYAGREDRCVSIRGFRVELAEIEATLLRHPSVKDAVVLTKEFAGDGAAGESIADVRLVAYVATDEDRRSAVDLLRSFLAARLPDYMQPGYFVILDRLPLSANGKIDYKALPGADWSVSPAAVSEQQARNDVERVLSSIFAAVLGLQHVRIEEDFFRLGGHSLLAAQTAAKIAEQFGLPLELRTFLEAPNVAALAKRIEAELKRADTAPGTKLTDREEIEL